MRTDFTLNEQWLIQPELDRISDDRGELQIPPKYMDVLFHLAKHAGQLVSRQKLLEDIWKDTVVVEESLTRAVSELRKLLGDDPRNSQIIETIPKKGYRLIAKISWKEQLPSNGINISEHNGSGHYKRPKFQILISLVPAILLAFTFLIIRILRSDEPTSSSIRLMPLTSYQGEESHPVLSPDGNRLAFRWDGANGYRSSIYVKIIGSEQPLRLTDAEYATEPAWSPDGRYILYIKMTDKGRELYAVPSLSGPERRLVEGVIGARDPVWSPDGAYLAFAYRENSARTNSIYTYHLESQILKQVTQPEMGHTIDRKPVFSPDGKKIAFIRTVDGQLDVYVLSLQHGQLKRITRTNQWVIDVDWAPDGKTLIYASREGIWSVDAAGEMPPSFLAAGGMRIDNISVARDSWRLAYQQAQLEMNIWKIEIDTLTGNASMAQRLIASSRVDNFPKLSPNEHRLAFISDRSGHPQLWITTDDGNDPVQLTEFNGCSVSRPAWSHDNMQIAFIAEYYGNADVFISDIDGSRPVQLTKQRSREISPYWSHNGKWLYFGSNRNEQWQIWKIPIKGGRAIQVTKTGGFKPVESPDGKNLYFENWTGENYVLMKMPISGGNETKLFQLESGWFEGWTVTSKGILYGWRSRDDRVLKFGVYDFETQERKELFRHVRSGFRFSANSTGEKLFFTQADRDESDIVLLDNFQ
ncbi:PD40 domain-containing protein [bacterium]|nr:PD40 domain-containing protein [bacterium]